MLDNILNTVKRSAERVQRRGEEVAQVARLKMEVFQLTRELDGHYARLGRAYHAGAEADLLNGIREDIRRAEEDISARERLIDELGVTPEEAAVHEQTGQGTAQSGQQSSSMVQTYSPAPQVHTQVSGSAPQLSPGAPLNSTPPNSTLGNSPNFTDQPDRSDLKLGQDS